MWAFFIYSPWSLWWSPWQPCCCRSYIGNSWPTTWTLALKHSLGKLRWLPSCGSDQCNYVLSLSIDSPYPGLVLQPKGGALWHACPPVSAHHHCFWLCWRQIHMHLLDIPEIFFFHTDFWALFWALEYICYNHIYTLYTHREGPLPSGVVLVGIKCLEIIVFNVVKSFLLLHMLWYLFWDEFFSIFKVPCFYILFLLLCTHAPILAAPLKPHWLLGRMESWTVVSSNIIHPVKTCTTRGCWL